MSKIVLKNGSTIAFTGDGDKLTGCQPDWVMRHLIYDGLTDEQKVIAARRPGPYRGPSYEEYLELKKKEFLSGGES